jgi:7,8-dihydropterin-6-yl-methyl-4-(beta-D-ribofuranosyl)aminobenzene 5'-phosphate synthase
MILWDAGVSKRALLENMNRMEIDPQTITMIALSHGHSDHFEGMTTILNEMNLAPEAKEWGDSVSEKEIESLLAQNQVPLIAHPAAYRERWWKKEDGTLVGPFTPTPRKEWEAAGARIITSADPYKLADGCWTTGYVPRVSFEKSGRPTQLLHREGSDFLVDDLEEDQAIILNLKDKGLVVLSGCAHSGIVNTIEHAKVFTGISKIHAVIGGFHLARASEEEITKTIEYIKQEKPRYVVPTHCSGFQAIGRFAEEMPEEFIEGVVGITYML